MSEMASQSNAASSSSERGAPNIPQNDLAVFAIGINGCVIPVSPCSPQSHKQPNSSSDALRNKHFAQGIHVAVPISQEATSFTGSFCRARILQASEPQLERSI